MRNFLLKMDSTTETTGGIGALPPFFTSKEPFCTCMVRKFPWPQEWSSYLYSSRAQLLQLALSLEHLQKMKFLFNFAWYHQLSSPRAHLSPTSKSFKIVPNIHTFWPSNSFQRTDSIDLLSHRYDASFCKSKEWEYSLIL